MNTEKAITVRNIGYKIISKKDKEAAIKHILNSILSYFKINKAFTSG